MKIGVLTFHHASNYGAVLQTYATCSILRRMGHQPVVLDYRPAGLYEHYFKMSWKRCGLVGQNFVNLRLNPKFRHFRERWLPVSSQCCRSHLELLKQVEELDAVFYGSDQIWNPKLFGGHLDPAFWASGIDSKICKVSISASFGGTDGLADSYGEKIAQLIQNFDAVSVREQHAADLLHVVAGVSATVLMDPVFSMDAWDELMEPMPGYEGCVFQFVLQQNQRVYDAAGALAERLHTRVISGNSGFKRRGTTVDVVTPSVGQWLWLIKHASHVVTNSFHATAFSLIFRKPFTVVELDGAMRTRNQRIVNLLQGVGLESRMVQRLDPNQVDDSRLSAPDYARLESELLKNKADFGAFIKNSLK